MANKAIPEIGVDTRLLADRLRKIGVGETVSYEDLTEVISRDVTNGARGSLLSARRHLQFHDQIVFECVRKVGLKRLGDSEIVSTTHTVIDGIRRKARRGTRRLMCVADYEKLSDAEKVKFNTYGSVLHVLSSVTKAGSIGKVEAEVKRLNEQLPLSRTLEAFKK